MSSSLCSLGTQNETGLLDTTPTETRPLVLAATPIRMGWMTWCHPPSSTSPLPRRSGPHGSQDAAFTLLSPSLAHPLRSQRPEQSCLIGGSFLEASCWTACSWPPQRPQGQRSNRAPPRRHSLPFPEGFLAARPGESRHSLCHPHPQSPGRLWQPADWEPMRRASRTSAHNLRGTLTSRPGSGTFNPASRASLCHCPRLRDRGVG